MKRRIKEKEQSLERVLDCGMNLKIKIYLKIIFERKNGAIFRKSPRDLLPPNLAGVRGEMLKSYNA